MPEQILAEFFEDHLIDWDSQEPPYKALHKVAELDITNMTLDQLEKLFEIQERLGRTWKIKRFISSSSAVTDDEPDETEIPPISDAKKLSLTEISTAEGRGVG